MISARVIADSVNPDGHRITSFILTYPRFIHSELMTHRLLSRNAASSRAIPVKKMLDAIINETAGPVWWGMNQKGMQAAQELPPFQKWLAQQVWRLSMLSQVVFARCMNSIGVHKQITNRLVEPFAHMTTLVTATEYGNFFNLRCHPDAQPEFQELAYQMLEAYQQSEPRHLGYGEWHLPFADKYADDLTESQLLKIATARAARVSYLNFEGDIDHEKDYDLHDRLAKSGHWSPFEHAAMSHPMSNWMGNFRGWLPYRKKCFAQQEHQVKFNPEELWKRRDKTNHLA